MLSLVDFTFEQGWNWKTTVRIQVWMQDGRFWRSDNEGEPFSIGNTIREVGMELNKWPCTRAGRAVFEAARHFEHVASFLDLRMSAPEDLDDVEQAEKAFWELVWRLESDPASLEKGPGLARVEFLPIAMEGVRHG